VLLTVATATGGNVTNTHFSHCLLPGRETLVVGIKIVTAVTTNKYGHFWGTFFLNLTCSR